VSVFFLEIKNFSLPQLMPAATQKVVSIDRQFEARIGAFTYAA
jgi:hypothetical protein